MEQSWLPGMRGRGGHRVGAGRPKKKGLRRASHLRRRSFRKGALHVTVRRAEGLPSMRTPEARRLVVKALRRSAWRFGMGVVQYSVQSNHVHLVVEARDERALSQGMQGLLVRWSRALNVLWQRRGKVWAERYFAQLVTNPTAMRNTLGYVLKNAMRHGVRLGREVVDPYSSGRWFAGWREGDLSLTAPLDSPVVEARFWLLREGWYRAGLISIYGAPGRHRAVRRVG